MGKELEPENMEFHPEIHPTQATHSQTAPAISCENSRMKKNPPPEIQKLEPEKTSRSGKYRNPELIGNILDKILPDILGEHTANQPNT